MYRFSCATIALLFLNLAVPTHIYTADTTDFDPQSMQRAIHNALYQDTPFCERLRGIFDRINHFFDRLMNRLTERTHPATLSPATVQPNNASVMDSHDYKRGAENEADLEAIRQSFEQLNLASTEALNTTLTGLERETAATLAQHSATALKIDTIAGGGCVSVLFWLYQLDPAAIIRAAPTRTRQTRFVTGLEIPAALGVVGSVIGPFLKPIACIIGIAYLHYKVKHHFLDPYKQKHDELLGKFTQDNMRHRDQMQKMLVERSEQDKKKFEAMGHTIEQVREHFVTIQGHFDAALAQEHKKFQEQIAAIRAANVEYQHKLEAITQTAHESQVADNSRLRDHLLHEHEAHKAIMAKLLVDTRASLALAEGASREVRESHDLVQTKTLEIQARVSVIAQLVAAMKKRNEADSIALQRVHASTPPPPVTTPLAPRPQIRRWAMRAMQHNSPPGEGFSFSPRPALPLSPPAGGSPAH